MLRSDCRIPGPKKELYSYAMRCKWLGLVFCNLAYVDQGKSTDLARQSKMGDCGLHVDLDGGGYLRTRTYRVRYSNKLG